MGQTTAILEKLDAARPAGREALVTAIGRLTASGELPPGSQLPTIRAVAARLGLSTTTVEAAWRELERSSAIVTRGRAGTFVAGGGDRRPAERYRRLAVLPEADLDLASGTPDAKLLPELGPYLGALDHPATVRTYQGPTVLPELELEVRKLVRGAVPEKLAMTVVDGALDALDRLLGVLVRPGQRVGVEEPGFPPVFDLVEAHGGTCVPIGVDDKGPLVADVEAAIESGIAVMIVQPRAQNPTGAVIDPTRAKAIARVLKRAPNVTVVEDDHTGDVSSAELTSLSLLLPARVAYVRSFSKSHGPDLRLAAILAPDAIIDALEARRRLGPSWSSRLLQSLLAAMLADAGCRRSVARAAKTYASRRRAVANALAANGIATTGADGLNLWISVADEDDALLTLATDGIAIAPGSPFMIDATAPDARRWVRVTTALATRPEEVATRLVAAARARARVGRTGSVR